MADYNYSPWQEAAQGMGSLGQSINQIAVGLAQQKFQQNMLQQQMQMKMLEMQQQEQLGRQHGRLYDAQTTLAKANETLALQRAKGLAQTEQAKQGLGDSAWYAGMVQAGQNAGLDMGPRQDIAMSQMLQNMAMLPDSARSELPVNVAQMFQMRDRRLQQLLATGTKAAMNVPAGGTMMDTVTGTPDYLSPRTLNQGQVLVPGMGGDRLAEGLPPRPGSDMTSQLLGRLGSIRGQGADLFGGINREDPTIVAVDQLIQQLLPQLQQKMSGSGVAPEAQAPVEGAPQVGSVVKGYRFKGGNPADKNNWEKVQ